MENIELINGRILECSSTNNDYDSLSKLRLKFLICPLDELNRNKKGLRQKDLTEEEKYGIQGLPVVCKVVKKNGVEDFTGHNRKQKIIYKNGKKIVKNEYDTVAVGYHENVQIEDIDIDGVTKTCITAECCIWKRYENVVAVIERRKDNLSTSWELAYGDSYKQDGGTWLKDIVWKGNCLLGASVTPAYADAGMLDEVAEMNEEEIKMYEEIEAELSSAIVEDFNIEDSENINKEGDSEMEDNKNNKQIDENSALSMNDIRCRLIDAIEVANRGTNRWVWNIIIFPTELVAYGKIEGDKAKDTDWCEYKYTINSDDTVSITSTQEVEMVFKPKNEVDEEIAELNKKYEAEVKNVVTLGESLKVKDEEIAQKDEEIASFKAEIEELKPFKEEAERQAKEAEEAELQAKRDNLKELAVSSGYFTEEEVSSIEELSNAIQELNETKVNELIGKRVVEQATEVLSAKKKKSGCAEDDKKDKDDEDEKDEDSKKRKGCRSEESQEFIEENSQIDLNADEEFEYNSEEEVSLSSAINKIKKRRF